MPFAALGILELRRFEGKRSSRREDAEATGRARLVEIL